MSISVLNAKSNIDLMHNIFNEKVGASIFMNLEPKDLLTLYITNKQQFKFFNNMVNDFNTKYNTNASSFIEFIKQYNNTLIINSNISYLYNLENNIEIPGQHYINYVLTNNIRNVLIEWIINVYNTESKRIKQSQFIGLTITLYDLYVSKHIKTHKKLVVIVCMYIVDKMLNDDIVWDIDEYLDMVENVYTYKEFENMNKLIFDTLNGMLILPSTVFFININDENVKDLVYFSYLLPELIKYKPSMIAEAISYIVYKTYKIYDISEINDICNIIITNLNTFKFENQNTIYNIIQNAKKHINYTCENNIKLYMESTYKYTQPWHIGEYKKLEVIGQGAYGKVRKIKLNTCNKDYVVKTNIQEDVTSYMIEIAILNQLRNTQNVINICNYKIEKNKISVIMPLMNGDLKSLIKNYTFNINNIPKYFKQIVLGLHTCHYNDIIHRDIKPDNILYDATNDEFKLIDFGISLTYSSIRVYVDPEMAATFNYRAPEALLRSKHYNKKIDIWALGVVFYYILTNGKSIVTKYDNIGALIEIFKIFGTPNNWSLYDNSFIKRSIKDIYPNNYAMIDQIFSIYTQMITPCFIYDPDKRPNTTQLLNILTKYYNM